MERATTPWIAGFEGDRWVVLTRLGPFHRISLKLPGQRRRPTQRFFPLAIEEWSLVLSPPPLGPLCELTATLDIRFQTTLSFARQHAEHLEHLGDRVRTLYRPLILDAAEEGLRTLESGQWLEGGCADLERAIEEVIQELLALRHIQSRCHCRINPQFKAIDLEQLDQDLASSDPSRNQVALSLLRQQRDAQARIAREQHQQRLLEQRLRLEQRAEQLELLRQETELIKAMEAEATLKAREQILAEERRKAEQIQSEGRLVQERLSLETQIRAMEIEASLEEKKQREVSHPDVQAHLQREIELLAMERQRLALEDEIQRTKKSRAQGWFTGTRGPSEDDAP